VRTALLLLVFVLVVLPLVLLLLLLLLLLLTFVPRRWRAPSSARCRGGAAPIPQRHKKRTSCSR